MFTWNYRVVNDKRNNGGEDWYVLREVVYNKKGEPTGYAEPCLGSETVDGMTEVWEMMCAAMEHPPLQESDFNFIRVSDDEEDEE
jgi:hypothetical protein